MIPRTNLLTLLEELGYRATAPRKAMAKLLDTVWSFRKKGPEGKRPGVLEFHVQPVTTLAFAPGAMRLASGGRDGGVVVWSLGRNGKGRPVGAQDVEDPVAGLYWRPDGGGLAALDAQGGVTVWQIGLAKGRIARPREGLRNSEDIG